MNQNNQGAGAVLIDTEEDRTARQDAIRSAANYSLAVLGKAFIHRGSGRFINLYPDYPYASSE